jgi:AAA15 family ATPase/GTPase
MIHEITIENFGSVRDETTINFRVARNAPDMVRFRPSLSRSDVRLPTVAAFVGPNGSGKSTILRAVIATLHFLVNSSEINPGSPILSFMPFLANTDKSRSTRIEITFDARWLSETDTASDIFRYELELGREKSQLAPIKVTYDRNFARNSGVSIFEK